MSYDDGFGGGGAGKDDYVAISVGSGRELPEFNSAATSLPMGVFRYGDPPDLLAMVSKDVEGGAAFFTKGQWEEESADNHTAYKWAFARKNWDFLCNILRDRLFSAENMTQMGRDFEADLAACRLNPTAQSPWCREQLQQLIKLVLDKKETVIRILEIAQKTGLHLSYRGSQTVESKGGEEKEVDQPTYIFQQAAVWEKLLSILKNRIFSSEDNAKDGLSHLERLQTQFEAKLSESRTDPYAPLPWLMPDFIALKQFVEENMPAIRRILRTVSPAEQPPQTAHKDRFRPGSWDNLRKILCNSLVSPENLTQVAEMFKSAVTHCQQDPTARMPWELSRVRELQQFLEENKKELSDILSAAYLRGQQIRKEEGVPPSCIIHSGHLANKGMGAFYLLLVEAIRASGAELKIAYSPGSERIAQLVQFFNRRIELEDSVREHVDRNRRLPSPVMRKLEKILQQYPIEESDSHKLFQHLLPFAIAELTVEDVLQIFYFFRSVIPGTKKPQSEKDVDSVVDVDELAESLARHLFPGSSPEAHSKIVGSVAELLSPGLNEDGIKSIISAHLGDALDAVASAQQPEAEVDQDPLVNNPELLTYLIQHFPVKDLALIEGKITVTAQPGSEEYEQERIAAIRKAMLQDGKLLGILRQQVDLLKSFFLHLSQHVFHLPMPNSGLLDDVSMLCGLLPRDCSSFYGIYWIKGAEEFRLSLVTTGPQGETADVKRMIPVHGCHDTVRETILNGLREERDQLNALRDLSLVDSEDDVVSNGRGVDRTEGKYTKAFGRRMDQLGSLFKGFFDSLFLALPAGISGPGAPLIEHANLPNSEDRVRKWADSFRIKLAQSYVREALSLIVGFLPDTTKAEIIQTALQAGYDIVKNLSESIETERSILEVITTRLLQQFSVVLSQQVAKNFLSTSRVHLESEFGSAIFLPDNDGEYGVVALARLMVSLSEGDQSAATDAFVQSLTQTLKKEFSANTRTAAQDMLKDLYFSKTILPNIQRIFELMAALNEKESADLSAVKFFSDTVSIFFSNENTVANQHVALIFIQLVASQVTDVEFDNKKEAVRADAEQFGLQKDSAYLQIKSCLDGELKRRNIKSIAGTIERAIVFFDACLQPDSEKISDLIKIMADLSSGHVAEENEGINKLMTGLTDTYVAREGAPVMQLLALEENSLTLFAQHFSLVVKNVIQCSLLHAKESLGITFPDQQNTRLVRLLGLVMKQNAIPPSPLLSESIAKYNKFPGEEPDAKNTLAWHCWLSQLLEAVNVTFRGNLQGRRIMSASRDHEFFPTEKSLPTPLHALQRSGLIPVIDSNNSRVFSLLAENIMQVLLKRESNHILQKLEERSKKLFLTYKKRRKGVTTQRLAQALANDLRDQLTEFMEDISSSHDVPPLIRDLATVAVFYSDLLGESDVLSRMAHAFSVDKSMRRGDSTFPLLASLVKLFVPLYCIGGDDGMLAKLPRAMRQYFTADSTRLHRDEFQQFLAFPDYWKPQSLSELRRPKIYEMIFALLAEAICLLFLFEQSLIMVGVFFGLEAYVNLRSILCQLSTGVVTTLVIWAWHFIAEMDRLPSIQAKLGPMALKVFACFRTFLPKLSGVSTQLSFNFLFLPCMLAEGLDWGLSLSRAITNGIPACVDEINATVTTPPPTSTTTTTTTQAAFSWSGITWGYFAVFLLGILWRFIEVGFHWGFPGVAINAGDRPKDGETMDLELAARLGANRRFRVHVFHSIQVYAFKLIVAVVSVDLFLAKWGIGCSDEMRAVGALLYGILGLLLNLFAFPCYRPGLTAAGSCCDNRAQRGLYRLSESPQVQQIAVSYNLLSTVFALFYFVFMAIRNALIVNLNADAKDISLYSGPYQIGMIVGLAVAITLLLVDRFIGLGGASSFRVEADRARRAREKAVQASSALTHILHDPGHRRVVRTAGHVQREHFMPEGIEL